MHTPELPLTLAGCLVAALVCGYLAFRLGLSPVVGYLAAGILVGPYTPGFVANRHLAEQLAEVGVLLLLFGVGLQFHVEDLIAVWRTAVPGALAASTTTATIGTGLGWLCGWGWAGGLFFGLSLAVASTVVLTRVLADRNELHTPAGRLAVGWLVVEDLITVLVLVLLPLLFGGAPAGPLEVAAEVGLALLRMAALVALVLVVGPRVLPWLLARAAATRSRELFTLTVLAAALGLAVGAAVVFQVSMALGAFLAGLVVGRSEFGLRAATEAMPLRDAFAVLFFVAVGLLVDPHHLAAAPWAVLATLLLVLVGKPLVAGLLLRRLGAPPPVFLAVALALGQIGEFSFLLADLGRSLGVLPDGARQTLVAAALGAITLNPLIYRLAGPLKAWAARRPRLWAWLNRRAAPAAAPPSPAVPPRMPAWRRAVVVGYGPVGQTVVHLLRANGLEPTVIDLNPATLERLAAEGVAAIHGDAASPDTLAAAGLDRAASLILSASDHHASGGVIRLARELNPRLRILARATYLREAPALRAAGADVVFTAEGEVALAVTTFLLEEAGATPEQVDRERDRVRQALAENAAGGRANAPFGS